MPTSQWIQQFREQGYAIAPKLVSSDRLAQLNLEVQQHINPVLAPVELEAQVGYPGAPDPRTPEANTIPRRLLHAYTRSDVFRDWGLDPTLKSHLSELFGSASLALSQNHHNCIMTKVPQLSSSTGWHRDMRYWSFDRPELITAWLALGNENTDNGALKLIPGSHQMKFGRGSYDAQLFFREDIPRNQRLLTKATPMRLNPGDVLFFDALTLHCASNNQTEEIKCSLVYTFRQRDNQPIPGTKSAKYPDIPL